MGTAVSRLVTPGYWYLGHDNEDCAWGWLVGSAACRHHHGSPHDALHAIPGDGSVFEEVRPVFVGKRGVLFGMATAPTLTAEEMEAALGVMMVCEFAVLDDDEYGLPPSEKYILFDSCLLCTFAHIGRNLREAQKPLQKQQFASQTRQTHNPMHGSNSNYVAHALHLVTRLRPIDRNVGSNAPQTCVKWTVSHITSHFKEKNKVYRMITSQISFRMWWCETYPSGHTVWLQNIKLCEKGRVFLKKRRERSVHGARALSCLFGLSSSNVLSCSCHGREHHLVIGTDQWVQSLTHFVWCVNLRLKSLRLGMVAVQCVHQWLFFFFCGFSLGKHNILDSFWWPLIDLHSPHQLCWASLLVTAYSLCVQAAR